jgi:hypothetical protein
MRAMLNDTHDLARRLAALEKELTERLDVHESAIVSILQRVMDVIDPPAFPEPPHRKIGFRVKKNDPAHTVASKSGNIILILQGFFRQAFFIELFF